MGRGGMTGKWTTAEEGNVISMPFSMAGAAPWKENPT